MLQGDDKLRECRAEEKNRKPVNRNISNKKKKSSYRKKHRRVAITRLMILLIFVISLGLYYFKPEEKILGDASSGEDNTAAAESLEEPKTESQSKKDKWTSIFNSTDKGSKNILLVNRDNLLKSNYVPENLVDVKINFSPDATDEERLMTKESADALVKLVNGAEKDGVYLYGLSGYRSYGTQENLYNYNLSTQGYDYANQYVAKAGASEHQAGIAMDLATATGWITEDCVEAVWLKNNAYKYGFIVRYEKGKEKVTGYSYEPWHIRYVGAKIAKEIYTKGITLEEYCGE